MRSLQHVAQTKNCLADKVQAGWTKGAQRSSLLASLGWSSMSALIQVFIPLGTAHRMGKAAGQGRFLGWIQLNVNNHSLRSSWLRRLATTCNDKVP